MLVGNNIALVVYGLLMAKFLTPVFAFTDNQFIITLLQTIVATTIVLFTGEFLPKTIFRINPNIWLKTFSWVLFLFYTIMYPIAYASTWLSQLILKLFKADKSQNTNDTVFSRIDLSYLVQESVDGNAKEEEIDNEVKFFQNRSEERRVG